MTTLQFNVKIDTDCDLAITDTSTGFIPESETVVPFDSYKLSNGYFIDIITYNKYKASPLIVAKSRLTRSLELPEDNVYNLSQDAIYTVHRLFIMSEQFYMENEGTERFTDKTIFYSDGIDVYTISGDVSVKLSLGELLSASKVNSTLLYKSSTFVSTCHINKCYYRLIHMLVDEGCSSCNHDSKIMKDRDFLYMTLEVIEYLKSFNNISEIQKLLESVDLCGGFCKSISNNTSNCGCNG